MKDKRKVLESTEQPASLDRTMPAPGTPAEEGRKLGGITRTADSAMRGASDPPTNPAAAAEPKKPAAAGKASPSASTPATRSDRPASDAAADQSTPEDESPLESLGRAIGAPLSGEAAEKEPRR